MVRRTKNLIGFYRSKKKKVNGRKVYTGPKNGVFYKTPGSRKYDSRKRYIPHKYRKNVVRRKKRWYEEDD